jgi:hypothetical protein
MLIDGDGGGVVSRQPDTPRKTTVEHRAREGAATTSSVAANS